MNFKSIVHSLCVALLLAQGSPASAAETYAPAAKVGQAKTLNAIGCKGGFPDILGKCWKCPDGFGFGVNGGVGVGAIPIEGAGVLTYSYKLWGMDKGGK